MRLKLLLCPTWLAIMMTYIEIRGWIRKKYPKDCWNSFGNFVIWTWSFGRVNRRLEIMCLFTLEGLELFILTLLLLQFCKLGRIGLSWKDEAFGWLNGLVVSGLKVCKLLCSTNWDYSLITWDLRSDVEWGVPPVVVSLSLCPGKVTAKINC